MLAPAYSSFSDTSSHDEHYMDRALSDVNNLQLMNDLLGELKPDEDAYQHKLNAAMKAIKRSQSLSISHTMSSSESSHHFGGESFHSANSSLPLSMKYSSDHPRHSEGGMMVRRAHRSPSQYGTGIGREDQVSPSGMERDTPYCHKPWSSCEHDLPQHNKPTTTKQERSGRYFPMNRGGICGTEPGTATMAVEALKKSASYWMANKVLYCVEPQHAASKPLSGSSSHAKRSTHPSVATLSASSTTSSKQTRSETPRSSTSGRTLRSLYSSSNSDGLSRQDRWSHHSHPLTMPTLSISSQTHSGQHEDHPSMKCQTQCEERVRSIGLFSSCLPANIPEPVSSKLEQFRSAIDHHADGQSLSLSSPDLWKMAMLHPNMSNKRSKDGRAL